MSGGWQQVSFQVTLSQSVSPSVRQFIILHSSHKDRDLRAGAPLTGLSDRAGSCCGLECVGCSWSGHPSYWDSFSLAAAQLTLPSPAFSLSRPRPHQANGYPRTPQHQQAISTSWPSLHRPTLTNTLNRLSTYFHCFNRKPHSIKFFVLMYYPKILDWHCSREAHQVWTKDVGRF